MSITKSVPLKSYSSMKFFLERFGYFLTQKIDFESQNFAFFDNSVRLKCGHTNFSQQCHLWIISSLVRPSILDLCLWGEIIFEIVFSCSSICVFMFLVHDAKEQKHSYTMGKNCIIIPIFLQLHERFLKIFFSMEGHQENQGSENCNDLSEMN